MLLCKFCERECKNTNSLRNHERLCKFNPERSQEHIQLATNQMLKLTEKSQNCIYCGVGYGRNNIKRHENSCKSNPKNIKECPVCETMFSSESATCSYSCSNTYFRHGNEGGFNYLTDDELVERGNYRKLCWRYHKKECVVCGENLIVEVHHYNEDHNDNRPENYVPLCPTHHKYMHSRFKTKIEKIVNKYNRDWVIG